MHSQLGNLRLWQIKPAINLSLTRCSAIKINFSIFFCCDFRRRALIVDTGGLIIVS